MYGVYHVDMGRCISDKQEFRCKEHTRHLLLGQPENSAVAECIMGTWQHEIQQRLQNG